MSWLSKTLGKVYDTVSSTLSKLDEWETYDAAVEQAVTSTFEYFAGPSVQFYDTEDPFADPPRRVTMEDTYDFSQLDDWYGVPETGVPSSSDWNTVPEWGGGQVFNVDQIISAASGRVFNGSGGGGGGALVPVAGAMPLMAAAGSGLVSLGSKLARMFGKSAGTFIINGVRGNMAQLWPLVRRYGPVSVAGALGIGAASLADLLMRAPTAARGRRRGVSSRDIRTTKRVIRFNRSLSKSIGTSSSRRGPAPHRHRVRSYR